MNGLARTAVLVALAAAAVVAGVVVWLLIPSGALREAKSAGDPDDASPSTPLAAARAASRAIAPKALSESEPVEGAASSRGLPLEIEVIAPTGRPAAKARLALVRDEKVLGAGTTGDDGLASFAAGTGEADLWVVLTGVPVFHAKIPLEAGRRRIDLPPGVRISGRVEVNDAAPRETVRLWANNPDVPAVDVDAWSAMNGDDATTFSTTSSGDFELLGLREGSEWSLNARTPGFRVDEILVGGAVVNAVKAPAHDVVIKCTRHPVVRGRVVAGEPRAPVPGAHCEVSLTGPTMTQTIARGAAEDGTFEFAIGNMFKPDFVVARFEITVRAPNDLGKTVVLDPAPDRDTDLGDVVIPAGRTIRYLARDAAGAPIAGAFARTRSNVDPATRTDAQGLGTILVPADASFFLVGALKYDIARVLIPAPLPDPLSVVLEPNAGIEVHVSAKVQPKVRVECEADQPFSRDDDETGNDPIHMAAGASGYESASFGGGDSEVSFLCSPENRVVIVGLKPGVPLTVSAIDSLDQTQASSSVTLARGEWKTVELAVTKVPRTIRGRVRDSSGQPLEGAEAQIRLEPEKGSEWRNSRTSAETDASGKFLISGVYDAVVDFSVQKKGYAPIVQHALSVPAEGLELDLTLNRGARITVRVVDAASAPIPKLDVTVQIGHLTVRGVEEVTPGSYVLADLAPDAQATVRVIWAQRSWPRDVRVKDGQVETITMPKAGKILVDYSGIGEGPFWLALKGAGESTGQNAGNIPRVQAGSPRVHEIGPVVAGEYEAVLRNYDATTPEPAVPQSVTVRPGEATRLVFHKR
jgi:hypothetical protein